MDTGRSKNDSPSKQIAKELPDNDEFICKDSVQISIECDEKSAIKSPKDFSGLNETVLDIPLPRAEKVKKSEVIDKKSLFGFKRNDGSSRTVWVQFAFGHVAPSEGPPLEYDPETRNSFVRKVFIILLFMLLMTFALVMTVYMTPIKDHFLKFGIFIIIPALVILLAVSYAFSCSQCTRSPPCNYICLFGAVLAMSVICIFVTVNFRTEILLFALVVTVGIVFICTLLALTRFDFTSWLLYVVVIMSAICLVSIVFFAARVGFGFYLKPLHLAILIAGLIMNSIMLVIELQMVLGGKAVELSEEDYAIGAFMLYMSIVEIFLKLVQILGLLDD